MANWEDLSIKMPIDRSSTLRVLISSGDKVIGQCSVNRAKLLGGRKNQKGLFVVRFRVFSPPSRLLGFHSCCSYSLVPFKGVLSAKSCVLTLFSPWHYTLFFSQLFGELDHNGKIAGKIKFVYSLEDPAASSS
jgi:hypothetical protein